MQHICITRMSCFFDYTRKLENFDSLSNQPQTSFDLLRIAKENAISNWSVTINEFNISGKTTN